jgi:hypothetical protein
MSGRSPCQWVSIESANLMEEGAWGFDPADFIETLRSKKYSQP